MRTVPSKEEEIRPRGLQGRTRESVRTVPSMEEEMSHRPSGLQVKSEMRFECPVNTRTCEGDEG